MSLPRSSGFVRAFGLALGLEGLAVAALLVWFAGHPPPPPAVLVPLQIESASIQPDKPLPKIEAPKPLPKVQPVRTPEPPQVQPKLAPMPIPTVATPPVAETVATAAPAPVAAATAQTALVPAPPPQPPLPPPSPPSPPSPATQADLSSYNARLTAAAQAAFSLPQVAIDLNFRGKARIGFNMRDASPSAITVVQSSGLGVVDRAAVKAVQTAQYPQPPAALRGKEIAYLIWVSAY